MFVTEPCMCKWRLTAWNYVLYKEQVIHTNSINIPRYCWLSFHNSVNDVLDLSVFQLFTRGCLHGFCSIFILLFWFLWVRFSVIFLYLFLYLCPFIFPFLYVWHVATVSSSYPLFINNLNIYWIRSCITRPRCISDFYF